MSLGPAPNAGRDVREGILRGAVPLQDLGEEGCQTEGAAVRLRRHHAGGAEGREILEEKYGVAADVWSVTSYKELYRDGNACERWNMLHPGGTSACAVCHAQLKDAPGVLVAASDYVKALPESISQWMPRPLIALGTDGYGRSESRASLRDFFEVDAKHIVLATLSALASEKQVKPAVLQQAIKELGINPEKMNPAIS